MPCLPLITPTLSICHTIIMPMSAFIGQAWKRPAKPHGLAADLQLGSSLQSRWCALSNSSSTFNQYGGISPLVVKAWQVAHP